MKKYLVDIEFRYRDNRFSKTITIGVYDNFTDACTNGNSVLEQLEDLYPKSHSQSTKERFSQNGGPCGTQNNLITNLGYLKTPFDFFARVNTLNMLTPEYSIEEIINN